MILPELIHLFQEATKLEEQGKLQSAYDLCIQIDNDPNCSKSLKMTVGRTIDRLNRRQALELDGISPMDAVEKINESEPEEVVKDNTSKVYSVDVFALIGIPQIEDKMPIKQEDYNRIKEGIKKRGIINPLVALPNFKLVCGYNRLKIAKELELKTVPVIFKDIPETKVVEYAMKDNIDRRQLSIEQIAEYIAGAVTQETGRPNKGSRDKTNEDIAKILGISKRTVQRAKKFAKEVEKNPQLKGQSIRSVLEEAEQNKLIAKKEYIIGVGDMYQMMADDLILLADSIVELAPNNGDKVKVVTQVYIRRRK